MSRLGTLFVNSYPASCLTSLTPGYLLESGPDAGEFARRCGLLRQHPSARFLLGVEGVLRVATLAALATPEMRSAVVVLIAVLALGACTVVTLGVTQ